MGSSGNAEYMGTMETGVMYPLAVLAQPIHILMPMLLATEEEIWHHCVQVNQKLNVKESNVKYQNAVKFYLRHLNSLWVLKVRCAKKGPQLKQKRNVAKHWGY